MSITKIVFYRRPDLARLGIPYCDVHLRRLEDAGKFPRRIKLTDGGRAVGWLASEVDAWVEARAASRNAA